MYLPGFSGIAKDLNTTVAKVSMSLSSYFIGISAGQLLYGPLLDRFGRKKTALHRSTCLHFGFFRLYLCC
ncbi:MFS transporter [Flavobacterium sp. CGRL2]